MWMQLMVWKVKVHEDRAHRVGDCRQGIEGAPKADPAPDHKNGNECVVGEEAGAIAEPRKARVRHEARKEGM